MLQKRHSSIIGCFSYHQLQLPDSAWCCSFIPLRDMSANHLELFWCFLVELRHDFTSNWSISWHINWSPFFYMHCRPYSNEVSAYTWKVDEVSFYMYVYTVPEVLFPFWETKPCLSPNTIHLNNKTSASFSQKAMLELSVTFLIKKLVHLYTHLLHYQEKVQWPVFSILVLFYIPKLLMVHVLPDQTWLTYSFQMHPTKHFVLHDTTPDLNPLCK